MPLIRTTDLVEKQSDEFVVDSLDITNLRIGEAIIGLPNQEPFKYKFEKY